MPAGTSRSDESWRTSRIGGIRQYRREWEDSRRRAQQDGAYRTREQQQYEEWRRRQDAWQFHRQQADPFRMTPEQAEALFRAVFGKSARQLFEVRGALSAQLLRPGATRTCGRQA